MELAEKRFVLDIGNEDYYVGCICPVVAFESSYDLAKARVFKSVEEIECEVKAVSLSHYRIVEL